MKKILIMSLFVASLSSCISMKKNGYTGTVTVNGKIEKLGMSTFQYGTHLIKADNKTYALKSAAINLDNYVDKPVTVKGKKVAGYPIDGGPELLEVTLVKF
ncbi:hypothetical protein ACS5PU_18690 [Pedobacter sp. GSP4]|uniref:hypothetical protein n=1 Tax=Pedobacter sp. GSP4 TaxID=3453716 RepID=UPI003EECB5BD